MLKLSALLALTDHKVVYSSGHYRIASLITTKDSDGDRFAAIVYGGSKPARSALVLSEPGPEAKAFCMCSCEYFAMNVETVLVMHGSAKPARAGGQLPTTRNPKLKPGLCPHLYLLATSLLKKWQEDARALADADQDEKAQGNGVNPKLKTLT